MWSCSVIKHCSLLCCQSIVAVKRMDVKWQSFRWAAYQLGWCSYARQSWSTNVHSMDQRY